MIFSMSGALKVERVKKMRDFAFIHYSNRAEAESALEKFNGIILDGCVLEVTWAKPPDTQKQKFPNDKKFPFSHFYKYLNCDNIDNIMDFNLLNGANASSGLPILARSGLKSRLPFNTVSGLKSITKPVQLLHYICLENGWGEPTYNVSYIDSDPNELLFVCTVFIPGLPSNLRKHTSDKLCSSPEEAKFYAAYFVLRRFGITDIDPVTPYTGPPASNGFTPFSKNYGNANGSFNLTKSDFETSMSSLSNSFNSLSPAPKKMEGANNDAYGTCPSKSAAFFCTPKVEGFKSHIPSMFEERGQGDASNFNLAGRNAGGSSSENTSLWDSNTPLEPNSILGMLASMLNSEYDASAANDAKI